MIELPKITVVLPHLSTSHDGKTIPSREEGLRRCVKSVESQTYPREKVQILVVEGDDTVPQKVHRALQEAAGDYIVYAANDMEFSPTAFELAVADSVEKDSALVAFAGNPTLPDEGNICEHFLIRKSFVSCLEGGQVFSLDFHHTGCDNWLWAQAKAAGQAHKSTRAITRHYHFSVTGEPMDEVYSRGWSKSKRERDKKTLERKLATLGRRKKIVVYTITKNESKFIKRYCESAADADYVVVVDTGSSDDTAKIAKECGAIVHSVSVSPWRFDVARNASLSLLPGDADICIALDADEILTPGWRQEIEKVWKPDTTRLRYLYDWGADVRFMCDKIHARNGYLWKHPCHERLTPDPRTQENFSQTNSLIIQHLPDQSKSRGQYLDLLAVGAKEDPGDARNSFYYARELTFYSKWEEAIVELKRYLSLPAANWGAERGYASRLIGRGLEMLGSPTEAEGWYVKATLEAPERRESWVDLADYYHRTAAWDKCLQAAKRALVIDGFRNDWPNDPAAWGSKPHDLAALASYYTGDLTNAREHGKNALAIEPDNSRLQANMSWYTGQGPGLQTP